jgi:hypothetical protein
MNKLITFVGDVAGVVGILVCAITGAARVLGHYELGGVGTIALFTVGMGVMVFACLAKLHVIASRLPAD